MTDFTARIRGDWQWNDVARNKQKQLFLFSQFSQQRVANVLQVRSWRWWIEQLISSITA
ncbi:hypothetical protein [Paraburkholderia sp. BCC1884]|uniref:hypothetical protein n=1 Tax=Paraburkholderia sp. BCC1884 TaxID=2562668 RepID=UPI0016429475|nr:hypothetical protein [Paraburkholderia sp. BCC1884]